MAICASITTTSHRFSAGRTNALLLLIYTNAIRVRVLFNCGREHFMQWKWAFVDSVFLRRFHCLQSFGQWNFTERLQKLWPDLTKQIYDRCNSVFPCRYFFFVALLLLFIFRAFPPIWTCATLDCTLLSQLLTLSAQFTMPLFSAWNWLRREREWERKNEMSNGNSRQQKCSLGATQRAKLPPPEKKTHTPHTLVE